MISALAHHAPTALRIKARDIHSRLHELGVIGRHTDGHPGKRARSLITEALRDAGSDEEAISGILRSLRSEKLIYIDGAEVDDALAAAIRIQLREYGEIANEQELAEAFAHDQGVEDARSGVQSVRLHPECDLDGTPQGFDEFEAFCQIEFHEDAGDEQVGIPPYRSWVLAENQTGTALERLIERYVDIESALEELLGQFDQAHTALNVERSPSAQAAIAQATRLLAERRIAPG